MNTELIRFLLWIVPSIITISCLYDSYDVAIKTRTPLSFSAFQDFRTAKWLDYWTISIGIQCVESLFGYVKRSTGDHIEQAASSRRTVMVYLQSCILLWWIVGNRTLTEEGQYDSAEMAKENLAMPERTPAGEGTSAKMDSSTSTPSTLDLDSTQSGITSMKAEQEHLGSASRMRSLETATSQQKTELGSRKTGDSTKLDSFEVQLRKPAVIRSRHSPSSSTSEGTLSDDESAYSETSGYETDLSESSSTTSPQAIRSDRRAPAKANSTPRAASAPKGVKKAPARNVGKADSKGQLSREKSRTLLLPENATSAITPKPTLAVEPTKQKSPSPQPSTSRILAQLDDLLLTELEELARSPFAAASSSRHGPQSLSTPVTPRLMRNPKIGQETMDSNGLRNRKSEKNESASMRDKVVSYLSRLQRRQQTC